MTETKDIRWKQRFENYKKAFNSLQVSKEAYEKDEDDQFIRDSVIQRYEFTIELAWKTMKDYLEEQGFTDVSSPKGAARRAFQEGLVTDGAAWIEALEDRNKTSHIYEESMAIEIATAIVEVHFLLFRDLYLHLKREYDA